MKAPNFMLGVKIEYRNLKIPFSHPHLWIRGILSRNASQPVIGQFDQIAEIHNSRPILIGRVAAVMELTINIHPFAGA